MNANTAKVIALKIYNPEIKAIEIAKLVGVSRERVRQILIKYDMPTKVSKMHRPCVRCGEDVKHYVNLFCSSECRYLNFNIELECEVCKERFYRLRTRHELNLNRGYEHVYCSKQCQGHWLGKNYGAHTRRGKAKIVPIKNKITPIKKRKLNPRRIVMKTYQDAVKAAYEWSKTKPFNVHKMAAKTYIEAMPQAEQEGKDYYNSEAKGRKTQLVYILANLQYWKGENARIAKKLIKEYVEELPNV